MKSEDRIVEILAEMLVEFREMKEEQKETNKRLESLEDDMHISHSLLKHHEEWFRRISRLLEEDVPRYEKVVRIEPLSEGRAILHASKS